jgi:hypothetical protein
LSFAAAACGGSDDSGGGDQDTGIVDDSTVTDTGTVHVDSDTDAKDAGDATDAADTRDTSVSETSDTGDGGALWPGVGETLCGTTCLDLLTDPRMRRLHHGPLRCDAEVFFGHVRGDVHHASDRLHRRVRGYDQRSRALRCVCDRVSCESDLRGERVHLRRDLA